MPDTASLSSALEDYLETVFDLVRRRKVARVRDIARARDVKAGSVSPALRRLAELGLVEYTQREYVGLTPEGEKAARRVQARHDLLTRFFSEVLGMPAPTAETQACAMEHSLSDDGMDRLVRFFEFLSVCPHTKLGAIDLFRACARVHQGAERCPKDCSRPAARTSRPPARHTVADLAVGERGRVAQVEAQGAIRQRLLDLGVLPGVEVELERVAPAGDPVWIRLQGSQLALRRKEAQAIRLC